MKAMLRTLSAVFPCVARVSVVASLATLLIAPAITGVRAQAITEGGSPLYVIAVRESVLGLRGRNAPAQAAQTPPAGVAAQTPALAAPPTAAGTNTVAGINPTPEFLSRYLFCTNCQAYHLRTTPLTSILQQNASNALYPATTLLTNRTLLQTNQPPSASGH